MKRRLLTYAALLTAMMIHAETNPVDSALQMLADFTPYLCAQYLQMNDVNSAGESMSTFKGENTFGNNEQGVRHNADLSMVTAFLCYYAKNKVTLPQGVTWKQLEQMAMRTLVYAYSTHKANKLYPCKDQNYWGSVSKRDNSWESSLWAMSVAYSAFFQWKQLSSQQHQYIYLLLKAECNYELERDIPTQYLRDTKAEENGWECDILAATLGLFPNDKLASRWFEKLRQFAINTNSHPSDKNDKTVIDPQYDNTTVADLYRGANLYEDYTLQNHNYFHTSYQNVVIQELGEAALALRLFQTELHKKTQWSTNALMHHNHDLMEQVLYPLCLPDGELAMPNGNDWSLFLYDQITSYSTMACFMNDPDALYLEQQALKQIARRQATTPDGSWLLRPDVSARRMGVQAHRVMMTWLMHHVMPTGELEPSSWKDIFGKFCKTRHIKSQDIAISYTPQRFMCFSWSDGLNSTTGYFAPFDDKSNNIVVPYKNGGTGNFIGWHIVKDHPVNAKPIYHTIDFIDSMSFVASGSLSTNDSQLLRQYLVYSTPSNAIIYIDQVKALSDCVVTGDRTGQIAISSDPFTQEHNHLSCNNFPDMVDNGLMRQLKIKTNWININDCVSVVNALPQADNIMAYGDRHNNNSILTSHIYPSFSDEERQVAEGDVVSRHVIIYYSNITKQATEQLYSKIQHVDKLPNGWIGLDIPDTDGTTTLLLIRFADNRQADTAKIVGKHPAAHTLTITNADGRFVTRLQ